MLQDWPRAPLRTCVTKAELEALGPLVQARYLFTAVWTSTTLVVPSLFKSQEELAVPAAALTVRVAVAVRVRPPPVPVIVSGKLVAGVETAVPRVSTDDPDVVMDVGLKLAVVPEGSPLTLRPTAPVKPPAGVTLTV